MKVTILGSGSATPSIGRHPSSLVLEYDSHLYLLDCGEGTQWRLLETETKISKINYIFVSHLHGDHYLGLIGLLSTMHSYGRKNDLYLFGPPGLNELLTIQFYYQQTQLEYKIILKEIDTTLYQKIGEDEKFEFYSIPLQHRIPTSGYLFIEKPKQRNIIKEKIPADMKLQHIQLLKSGQNVKTPQGDILYKLEDYTYPPTPLRKFAYCTDTIFDKQLIPLIAGVNLLYHESTFLNEKESRAKETHHSTAAQAATIAKEAKVKQLIIGHFSARYKDIEPFLSESRQVFKDTMLAEEGKSFDITY